MNNHAEKFTTSFNELLINSVLVPIAAYLEEKKIEVDLKELKELFSLPETSGCVYKPLRSKNPQVCGKETLPGEEYCKTHATNSRVKKEREEKNKPPLLSRVPKSLTTQEKAKPQGIASLTLKNLPPLTLSKE